MKEVRIGLVGAGWMGKAHANAFKNVPLVFGTEPAVPVLEVIADINPEWARAGVETLGFKRWTTEWREVVADPAVDAVDITVPNDLHAEIALAALKAGKAVYCEKPLAMNAEESARMAETAAASGAVTLVGYNYLKNPAQGFARQLVQSGAIGEVTQFRGTFDQDFMSDPDIPFSWRHDRKIAGSGALGDMASHVLSFSQFLVGDVAEVCGMTGTFIPERPVAAAGSGQTARAGADTTRRAVENEDAVQVLVRFANGAVGTIESSRVGMGRKLWLTYEIQGTKGALFYTQERMNELKVYRHDDPAAERGYKTVYIGPEHPGYSGFHPLPGIGLGYNDLKIIEARDFVAAAAGAAKAEPDFGFGHKITLVIDAVLKSVEERRWVRIDEIG